MYELTESTKSTAGVKSAMPNSNSDQTQIYERFQIDEQPKKPASEIDQRVDATRVGD